MRKTIKITQAIMIIFAIVVFKQITSKIISTDNLNMTEGKKYNFYVEGNNIFKYSRETKDLV